MPGLKPGKVRIVSIIDIQTKIKARIFATENGLTVQDVLNNAINYYIDDCKKDKKKANSETIEIH